MRDSFKIFGILLTLGITSLYLFPFILVYVPAANTKMMLAVVGLIWATFDAVRKRDATLSKDFITLSIWAALVSLCGLFSFVYNNTPDTTYASYIMSMWVWMGGAYAVVALIRAVHDAATVRLVSGYLMAVCVGQCLLAMWMDQNMAIKNFIDSIMISEGYMGRVEGRLYGLGASLDVAGMRFAAVLVIIAACMMHLNVAKDEIESPVPGQTTPAWAAYVYILAFFIIGIIGNMIGRTTTVGIAFAFAYMVMVTLLKRGDTNPAAAWKAMGAGLIIIIPAVIFMYNTNNNFHENIRFGFEGFFSLWEKGHWETHSNNMLQNMVVFPDNLKTWIIGDGYFDGPSGTDPYYTGEVNFGFYKYTDIGYLRFIFYFGLIGCAAFVLFMAKATQICIRRFPAWSVMFMMILLLNYVVWLKVASDLFSVLAVYICIQADEAKTLEHTQA